MMDQAERDGHAECSKTVRRVMLALTGVSVFCLLTLGQSDAALLEGGEVDLPFANTPVSFVSFLIIGPLILLGMTFYLHIFIDQLALYDTGGMKDQKRFPTIKVSAEDHAA